MPTDAQRHLRQVDDLLRARAPYEEIAAALDAADSAAGADSVRPGIVQRRLAIARLYGRNRDEIIHLANAGIPALWSIPALDAAPTILASCGGIPELRHHLVRLRSALEDARSRADASAAKTMDMVLGKVMAELSEPASE